jgi:hypothetical protein
MEYIPNTLARSLRSRRALAESSLHGDELVEEEEYG